MIPSEFNNAFFNTTMSTELDGIVIAALLLAMLIWNMMLNSEIRRLKNENKKKN